MVRKVFAGAAVLAAAAGMALGLGGCQGAARGCEAGSHVLPAGSRVVVDRSGNAWTLGSRVPGGVVVTCTDGTWQR